MKKKGILGFVLGVAAALAVAAVLAGDEKPKSPSAQKGGYSISIVPAGAETQILYIADPRAGTIQIYSFDIKRRTLRLSSVMRLEGRGGEESEGLPLVIQAIQAGPTLVIIYVVDTAAGKVQVYRHDLSKGVLALEAARDWSLDRKLDFFNAGPEGKELTPEIIRKSLP
jgi:hypothetical protein